MILHAGELVDCPVIDELILHTPLILSEHVPTDVQIMVHPAEAVQAGGRRGVSVHARTGQEACAGWVLHASATLGADQPAPPHPPAQAPVEVQAIDRDDFYTRLAGRGYGYSGLFESLRGIGYDPARCEVMYAEVALPADTDVTGYGIHPALLDAALHPLAAFDHAPQADAGPLRLPFVFSGITLHASAATRLHVQLAVTGADTYRLYAVDPTGAPVITIDTITLRAAPEHFDQPTTTTSGLSESLLELDWLPLPATDTPPAAAPQQRRCGRCALISLSNYRPACLRARFIPIWPTPIWPTPIW